MASLAGVGTTAELADADKTAAPIVVVTLNVVVKRPECLVVDKRALSGTKERQWGAVADVLLASWRK